MPITDRTRFRWLRTGDEAFAAMLAAVAAARESVRFETYIFSAGDPGDQFLGALLEARQRGVRVRVLLDAFGSLELPDSYWEPLRQRGGEMRWFNPLSLDRFSVRNHRKLLVCDERIAFVGGFNVSSEWLGDGVTRGWRDLGLGLEGEVGESLAASFDEMYALADFRHQRLARFRRARGHRRVPACGGDLLLSGPGRGRGPIRRALQAEFARARSIQIIAAYFLPPLRLRRAITRAARRGSRVQIILPGPSDIPLMQSAARSLYRRLLAAGVEVYEYQPQILHTKFVLVDDTVFVGSANLDPRSFGLNYDLLLRLPHAGLAAGAREAFADHLGHSRRIDRTNWRRARSFWERLRGRFAHFLFTRLDPFVTHRQLQRLR
jgi:cardiolipin synthase